MNIWAAPIELPVQPFREELLRGDVRRKLFDGSNDTTACSLFFKAGLRIVFGSVKCCS